MTRILTPLVSAIALLAAAPAFAQDHSMHDMPGMAPPGGARPAQEKKKDKAAAPRPKPTARPRAQKPAPDTMPAMDHSQHQTTPAAQQMRPVSRNPRLPQCRRCRAWTTPSIRTARCPTCPGWTMQHGQTATPGTPAMPGMQMTGTALPAGNAPPPPPPGDHFADRDFPGGEMARSRDIMMKDSGGNNFGQVLLNLFEYQAHSGRDGYRWDGEGFYGGDINRLWLKSEGEGEFGRGIDSAEVQVLYSRAIDPYFNLQGGIRQDFGRGPDRTYATIGVEGLAPGMFEVEGALFLSTKGDVLGRVEGYYDQRITQRLILQPRAEVNFAAQDIPENDIGSGLVNIELGARLRYEFSRQFAPYIGVSYLRKAGDTARLSRLAGEDVHATSFVAGSLLVLASGRLMAGANKRAGRYTHTQVGRRRAKEIRHGPFVPHEHPEDGCLLEPCRSDRHQRRHHVSGDVRHDRRARQLLQQPQHALHDADDGRTDGGADDPRHATHVRVEGRQHRADRRVAGRLLRQLCTHPHPDHDRRHGLSALDDPASFRGDPDVPGSKAQRSGSHPALRSDQALAAAGNRRDEGHTRAALSGTVGLRPDTCARPGM
jgi:copper resistance protein B